MNIAIFGAGDHARKAYHAAVLAGMRVIGFVDEDAARCSPVKTVAMLARTDLESQTYCRNIFIAIGRAEVRRRIMDEFQSEGWLLPSIVHPRASVAPDADVGPGVLVAACAVVESAARIGRGAIIDIGVIVDHDCVVAPFVHLAPGRVLPPRTEIRSE